MVITGFISHEKVFCYIITVLHFYYCFRIFDTLVLLIQISDNFGGSFTIYQSCVKLIDKIFQVQLIKTD